MDLGILLLHFGTLSGAIRIRNRDQLLVIEKCSAIARSARLQLFVAWTGALTSDFVHQDAVQSAFLGIYPSAPPGGIVHLLGDQSNTRDSAGSVLAVGRHLLAARDPRSRPPFIADHLDIVRRAEQPRK